jgi:hypothetical protein
MQGEAAFNLDRCQGKRWPTAIARPTADICPLPGEAACSQGEPDRANVSEKRGQAARAS